MAETEALARQLSTLEEYRRKKNHYKDNKQVDVTEARESLLAVDN